MREKVYEIWWRDLWRKLWLLTMDARIYKSYIRIISNTHIKKFHLVKSYEKSIMSLLLTLKFKPNLDKLLKIFLSLTRLTQLIINRSVRSFPSVSPPRWGRRVSLQMEKVVNDRLLKEIGKRNFDIFQGEPINTLTTKNIVIKNAQFSRSRSNL